MTALSWKIVFQQQLNTHLNCCDTYFKIIKFDSQETLSSMGDHLNRYFKPFHRFLIKIYLKQPADQRHTLYLSGKTRYNEWTHFARDRTTETILCCSTKRSALRNIQSVKFLYQWMNKSPALRLLCFKTCLHRVEEIRQTHFMLQRKHHLGTCHTEKEFFLKGLSGINHWNISPVCLDSPKPNAAQPQCLIIIC